MNDRPNTPGLEEHAAEKEQNTPNKAAVKAVIDYNDSKGIKYAKTDVFKHFGVAERTRFRMLTTQQSRRLHNDPTRKDPRGQKQIISKEQIESMDQLLQSEGFDARSMT